MTVRGVIPRPVHDRAEESLGVVGYTQFAGPGFYRIVAQGRASPWSADRLGCMRLVGPASDSGPSVTVLEGRVRDQAELLGVLNTLHELRFSLLSVVSLGQGPVTSEAPKAV